MRPLRLVFVVIATALTAVAQRTSPQCDLGWKPTADGHCELLTASVTGNLALAPVAPKTIPNWWLSSNPKKVLADPDFYKLWINDRVEVLSQIDPKFANLSFSKHDAFLWEA